MPDAPRKPPTPVRSVGPTLAWGAAVAVAALLSFGPGLSAEPAFADESAYYSQSYYLGVFLRGDRDDPDWLEHPAYDLPPLPKYLIGLALGAGGYPTPGPAEARAWYGNTSLRFDPPGGLTAARVPMVLTGALGCVAVYALGTVVSGRAVGVGAGLALAANPLYRLHARRAMSDVPCEAFVLAGLALALWAWGRVLSGRSGPRAWASAAAAGGALGLSALSKLSGSLGLIVVGVWAVLTLAMARRPWPRRGEFLGMAACVAGVASATFVGLDPFLTARPARPLPREAAAVRALGLGDRVRMMLALRLHVSAGQKEMFPHDALNTPGEKATTAAVQGFGRFGPFGPPHSDSTRRFDPGQDWGAVVWLPWVVAGAWWAWRRGRAQDDAGEAPTAWALLAHAATALVVVTAYLPMAWDRYLLPLQAPSALLASGVAVAGWNRLRLRTAVRGRRAPAEGV